MASGEVGVRGGEKKTISESIFVHKLREVAAWPTSGRVEGILQGKKVGLGGEEKKGRNGCGVANIGTNVRTRGKAFIFQKNKKSLSGEGGECGWKGNFTYNRSPLRAGAESCTPDWEVAKPWGLLGSRKKKGIRPRPSKAWRGR